MQAPKTPKNEADRLNALLQLRVLDTPPEERFDRYTRIAQTVFGVPIALVSLVDGTRQWFKSRAGLTACETDRKVSFCGHTILDECILEVTNATEDARFHDNPLVVGAPFIRFYAGAPLHSPDGYPLGTLCLIDTQPRQLKVEQRLLLRDLADAVQDELARVSLQQLEEGLAEKQKRADEILFAFPDMVFMLSAGGYFTHCYPHPDLLLSADQVIGAHIKDILPPDVAHECQRCLVRVLTQDSEEWMRYSLPGVDGNRYYEARLRRTVRGEVLVVSRDISQTVLAEQALARSNRELEQFAYVASHDLRQPLRMVGGYLQIIEKRLANSLNPETREMMDFAIEGARRMDQMLNSLLEYSRIGRAAETEQDFDTRQLLAEVLCFLEPAAREADASIDVEGDWPVLRGSPDEFSRLLQNLIANALKFFHPDKPPVLRVTGQMLDTEWQVSVTDNGIGIAHENKDRIFGIFQRLHARSEYGGNGIGLSICQKIVENLDGVLSVESQGLDQGSKFIVTIPKSRVQPQTGQTQAQEP